MNARIPTVRTERRTRTLWLDPLLVGTVAWSVLAVTLLLGSAAVPHRQAQILWVCQVPLDALLVWSSWRVQQHTDGAVRRFWRVLAIAGSLFTAGDTWQAIQTFAAPDPAKVAAGPVQSAFLAVGQLVLIVTMLMHPDASTSSRARLALWLDSATVLASGAALSWCFVVVPARDTGSDLVATTVTAGMCVVASFAAVRMALSGNAPMHRIVAAPMAACTVLVAATVVLPPDAMESTVALLLLRFLPSPLISSGPRLQQILLRVDPAPFGRRRRRSFSPLPYGAVVVAFATLVAMLPTGIDVRVHGAVAGVVAVTLLVVARQLIAFRDNATLIEELRAHRQQLHRQASSDGLTGLANRTHFTEQLTRWLEQRQPVTLLLVDLDNFKTVNDTMGHAAGDALLVEVAHRLRRSVREDDLTARLGGDEFAIALLGASVDQVNGTAERLLAAVAERIRIGHADAVVGASIGVASAGPEDDVETLVSAADIAMYAAKARGRGTWVPYTPELGAGIRHRAHLAASLSQALDDDRLTVVYQPIVRLDTGDLVGVEALSRWHTGPGGAAVRPDEFIPIAEDSGLIVALGRSVLRKACHQAGTWRREYATTDLVVTVNVTGRELREPGFAGDVARVLAETGVPADRLCLEVTETALFDDDLAVATLHELRARGTRLALDDFGTGASSLGLMLTCPITGLKLDRSFVESVTTVSRQAAVARAVSLMAASLELVTVAEGIETEEQASALRGMGYQNGQGFLFSPPVGAEDLERRWLRAGAASITAKLP